MTRCSSVPKSLKARWHWFAIHDVRATGSYIRGTNGTSNGIVPMLRVFNDTARYVDQGGGKRKGSFAIYIEPWHADVFDFLDLKKNHGKEENRARDLVLRTLGARPVHEARRSRWRVDPDVPQRVPWAFRFLGTRSSKPCTNSTRPKAKDARPSKHRSSGSRVVESQIETGVPYMLYKDAANGKSNQQNLGTIRSSNLCTEIIEYTAKDEVAVCNLASIAMPEVCARWT